MSESAPRYVTCRCEHCDGGIEFDANELGEANSLLPCPHCGVETLLLVPQNADLASQPLVTAPPLPSETHKAQRWVIVDTETDGLTAPIHVVEIAAQLMEGWETCGEPFQVFLNHNVHIPWSAVAIHGYTQEFLRANGRPPMEAHVAFKQYAGEFPIVAHNLGYDWNRALVPEWNRLGLKPAGCRGFCTVTLSRRVLPEADSYSLDELKSRFGLGSGPSHKAKADVQTVVRLFREVLRPRLESAGLTTFEAWRQFAQRTPVADCWYLIDPNRKPKEQQCNLNAHQLPKPDLPLTESSTALLADSQQILRRRTSRLANLTEVSIRNRTQIGNTPLHMAAKNGRIHEIPSNLFQLALFLEKNHHGQTPLHLAAQYGHLDQVPKAFLTRESLTVFDSDGNTPLHKAAGYEHIDQIPDEFLTSEFLKLRARNQCAWTVFHHVACANAVDQIPCQSITPEMWKARDGQGATPMDYLSGARSSWYQRVRQIPLLKSKCHRCFGGIEFTENGVGHTVNCPHCGQRTKLGANPFATPLRTKAEIRVSKCEPTPTEIPPPLPEHKRAPVIPMPKLTEETIRSSTKRGDTPLHRAAKNGNVHEIPRQLLQTELFMLKNSSGETPLHVAAKHGHLDQVPLEFLTKETLTMAVAGGVYSTGSGYMARTETVLHIAVRCGHAEQIPKEFLTPEFLSIEATGYRLHGRRRPATALTGCGQEPAGAPQSPRSVS